MNRIILGLSIALSFLLLISFTSSNTNKFEKYTLDSLRRLYSKPVAEWPKPTVDKGVIFKEFAPLPGLALNLNDKDLQARIELGKVLFFDPRLSSSNKISCASCHNPSLFFTDGLKVSIGHNEQLNTRNSPTLENVAFAKNLFWDGRASSLEAQAKAPLISPIEMHQDLTVLPQKLGDIKGYQKLFKAAFGDKKIDTSRIFKSLADFQRSLISGVTPFDSFLSGDYSKLTDQQLVGLNLFRNKARCMNCHYGPFFTDDQFHNLGLSNFGEKNQDLGLYNTTKNPHDSGKFKTPGLRNVMQTGPWFHDGSVNSITQLMSLYNMGMSPPAYTMAQLDDPLLPKNDKLLRGIRLSNYEINALVSFLHALSSPPIKIKEPKLP